MASAVKQLLDRDIMNNRVNDKYHPTNETKTFVAAVKSRHDKKQPVLKSMGLDSRFVQSETIEEWQSAKYFVFVGTSRSTD